jgi:hypothetical protein
VEFPYFAQGGIVTYHNYEHNESIAGLAMPPVLQSVYFVVTTPGRGSDLLESFGINRVYTIYSTESHYFVDVAVTQTGSVFLLEWNDGTIVWLLGPAPNQLIALVHLPSAYRGFGIAVGPNDDVYFVTSHPGTVYRISPSVTTSTESTSSYVETSTQSESVAGTPSLYTPNVIPATISSLQPILLGVILGLVVSVPISVHRHRKLGS